MNSYISRAAFKRPLRPLECRQGLLNAIPPSMQGAVCAPLYILNKLSDKHPIPLPCSLLLQVMNLIRKICVSQTRTLCIAVKDIPPDLLVDTWVGYQLISLRCPPAVNCGLVYVQNAARDGPTAWILTELVDRSVRVWENLPGVKVRQLEKRKPTYSEIIKRIRCSKAWHVKAGEMAKQQHLGPARRLHRLWSSQPDPPHPRGGRGDGEPATMSTSNVHRVHF